MPGSGTAVVNFGAFPGTSDTTATITGQATILAASLVEAWVIPTPTADHTNDEHWCETIRVMAGNVSAGVGFTVYAWNTSQLNEPLQTPGFRDVAPSIGGTGTRIYGQFTIGWVWS